MSHPPHPRDVEDAVQPDGADLQHDTSDASSGDPFPREHAHALLALHRRISEALTRPARTARVFRTLAFAAGEAAGASASVGLVEPSVEAVRMGTGTGLLADHEGELLPLEASFPGRALRRGAPVLTADLRTDEHAYRAEERDLPSGPAAALPLGPAGAPLGVLLLAREPGGEPFREDDLPLLRAVAEAVGSALENVHLFERARGSHAALESWRRGRGQQVSSARQIVRALRHEFNNPLAAILGHAQLLAVQPAVEGNPTLRDSVQAIYDESQRMSGLARSLAQMEDDPEGPSVDEGGGLKRVGNG